MEFYLVDDLECDLIVFHPYRTLMAVVRDSSGTSTGPADAEAGELGVGIEDGPRYWGTGEGKLLIWNTESKEAVGKPLELHMDSVLCVAYSSNGSQIVSGDKQGCIIVWDAKLRMALSFEEAKRQGRCAQCGDKGHVMKECPSRKDSKGSSSSSGSSSGSDSKPAAKEKGKGKEEKKPEFTKKRRIIREIIVDDSDNEEEASTSSNSSEASPNSQKKTERMNRVVIKDSDEEDFLRRPL